MENPWNNTGLDIKKICLWVDSICWDNESGASGNEIAESIKELNTYIKNTLPDDLNAEIEMDLISE